MKFPTTVNGIPCLCHVLHYSPGTKATLIDPASDGDFEFELLDRKGRRAKWLDRYITKSVSDRLYEEHYYIKQEEYYELRDYA
jgi:hypothetical protein